MSRLSRKLTVFVCFSLISGLSLSCSPPPPGQAFAVQSERESVSAYILKVEESFAIKAVEPAHQTKVDATVAAFENDLEKGLLNDYYQVPSFSILLAAGSEGSFFNTSDGAKQLSQSGAVFAQAVVFNPGEAAQVFKGQYSNGRFFFTGQQSVSPANVSYLIALNPSFETEIYKGKLSAGSEGSFLNPLKGSSQISAGSEGSFLTPLQSQELKAKVLAYQPAILRNTQEGEVYERKVSALKFIPPQEPLALAWTETFARLTRAYPDELHQELGPLRGLPKQMLGLAWTAGLARVRNRWIADCGSPPPDSGNIFPQRLPDISPVPQGWHSQAMDNVLADIPEFKAEIQALIKLPPPARQAPFRDSLAKYLASHAAVFEKHQWRDEFAPPPCVKPIKPIQPVPASPRPAETP